MKFWTMPRARGVLTEKFRGVPGSSGYGPDGPPDALLPGEVTARFRSLYRESPKAATDWYYAFSQDTNYIRRDRIVKDVRWKTDTPYGEMDITINLSKPEKDPKAIAAARKSAGPPLTPAASSAAAMRAMQVG